MQFRAMTESPRENAHLHLRYRPDIDGLRAVAIVPIFLFHAGVNILRGGFIGVDIFFVISGFLITSIIVREIDRQEFSFWSFYRRRAVRIFPALIVLLLAVMAVAPVFLLPPELPDFYHSAVAAALFVSNINLWWKIDYFAPASETWPLLHTWSLGVEEQFYIFFPLIVFRFYRGSRERLRRVFWVLGLVSFAWATWLSHVSPTASFYLLPSRGWELLIGSLIALGGFPAISDARLRLALAGLGAMAVAYSVLAIGDHNFPGPWAIVPCGGAALLIAYGEGTSVGKALSFAPVRWIGRMSYSLYLWHWPIIAFYRIEYGRTIGVVDTIILIVLSLLAATLSFMLVERPTMARFRGADTHKAIAAGLAALVFTAGAALAMAATAPSLWPVSPEVRRIVGYMDYANSPEHRAGNQAGRCFATGQKYYHEDCLDIDPRRRNVLLVGDSHAAQYWGALNRRFGTEVNFIQATASGCFAVIGGTGDAACTNLINRALGPVLDDGRIHEVVLASRWRDRHIVSLPETVRTLRARGISVTVIGPVVEYDGPYPDLLARAVARNDEALVDRLRVLSRESLDRRLGAAVRAAGGRYISVYGLECPDDRCRHFAPGGAPMHFDYGHLTQPAADWLVSGFPPF